MKDNWLKNHIDTAVIILTILTSMLSATIWMNGKFNDIEKDIAIIKTVFVMRNIMPTELANCEKEGNK